MDEAAGRLAKYREMRNFERTAEPAGGKAAPGNRFVVQRHRARRRHYDLRLELSGVLVSWAVPKGPTLDPKARRMAVHVEDHPLEYADFEGVIPPGEYGGGDVIVWDRGTWEPVDTDDPEQALADGNLHFDLFGDKLAGRFVLVHPGRDGDGKQWLLLHKQDGHARSGWDAEDHPKSVKSGLTNDEVAAAPAARWHGDRPAAEAEEPVLPVFEGPTEEELSALDALGARGGWTVGGRKLSLTNLDKVLVPGREDEEPITKRELIRYYASIAPVMLPYLAGRPLNTQRFPGGTGKPGFWHKEVPEHAPSWLPRWHNEAAAAEEVQQYLVPGAAADLAWLANFGSLELHAWTSRIPDVDRPTWTLFDIDPGPETSFDDVLVLARLHRTALEHLGLAGRPKVTGQRGIQVWVPVEPRYTFAETRAWAETVSKTIGKTVPELVSWAWRKDRRGGLARLDYTQNVHNKTLVAPYSVRPRPGAPVSVPLEWDELDDPDLRPDRWTIRTVADRVTTVGDPFSALLGLAQRLPEL
ncbi:DNA polymerase ligase N-terminal domain-containing protein [Amycolatopsis sp. PS_44_ISF1]|uniref:non-homologous end-joining DNA ligase LigD n=1 Tax=Amycolatopsis sp. PS_44_ISF1 TaxID=2974917 RepID=UPI0028DFC8FC|nr:DNA polymerase ligase N-terminal domain-containing protein [Amycolatopsis sp. PS_44_ISF1]MDT8915932.1 ATP-dependent DNA ligase [Amycolatopsis sp. PS_44_ISF1]